MNYVSNSYLLHTNFNMDGTITFNGSSNVGDNIKNVVYVWTRNDVPCYVGITSNKIHVRNNKHLYANTRPKLFQNKLRSNIEQFKCYIVFQSDNFEELKTKEMDLISKFKTYYLDSDSGYNLTKGGDGCVGYKHSQETLQEMKSRKHSNEIKKLISIAAKKQIRKPMSQDQKNLLSAIKTGVKRGKYKKTIYEAHNLVS
jgi:hypothetical protein